MLMVALLLLPILAITSLAIDLGQQYAQRRQMQNGADSAAMAGTRAVDQVRFSSAAPTSIYDAVQTSVTNHLQGQVGSVQCWLINDNQTRLSGDVCGSASAMTSGWAGAISKGVVAGVEVAPQQTRRTFFASAIGFTTTSAKTAAAATIQAYLGGQGSPFIVCGVPGVHIEADYAWPIMGPDGTLLQPYPQNIPLQGSQMRKCGAGGAFDGKNNSKHDILVGVPCTGTSPNFAAPCDHAWGNNGNGFEQNIRDTVAGAVPCATPTDPTNCDILVPVAESGDGNGNNDIDFHIVGWVVMHVTGNGNGNPKYYGSVVGPGVVSGGQGGTGGVITGQTLRVIKLVG